MKKILAISAITLVAVVMGFSLVAPVFAGAIGPAVVDKVSPCTLFDADGDIVPGDKSVFVASNSAKDTRTAICLAKGVDSDGALHIFNFGNTGLLCNANGQLTENWSNIVTPNGNSKISCHYHA